LLGAGLLGKRTEAAELVDGELHRLGIEPARRGNAAAEAGQHFLVEQDGRRARDPLIDDEADRVRSDINDGQGPPILQPALRMGNHLAGARLAFFERLNCAIRLGACFFSAPPRPDRLGLVMKYSCALNDSSPSSGVIRREVPSGSTS